MFDGQNQELKIIDADEVERYCKEEPLDNSGVRSYSRSTDQKKQVLFYPKWNDK